MPFELSTIGFENIIRDLAALAGHGSHTEQALLSATGKVLESAIAHTPMSQPDGLIERVNFGVQLDFARYDVPGSDGVLTTNLGRRGQLPAGTQWLRETSTRTGRPTNYIMRGGSPRRWSGERWARYQAAATQREGDLAQSLQIRQRKAVESIGLTRQSWVQIADDLGIPLRSPNLGKIRAAVPSNGRTYQNGRGTREESEEGISVVLENFMPSLIRQDGAGILQRAIDARLSAFETELSKGVLDDLTLLARRYPGLVVTG